MPFVLAVEAEVWLQVSEKPNIFGGGQFPNRLLLPADAFSGARAKSTKETAASLQAALLTVRGAAQRVRGICPIPRQQDRHLEAA